MKLSFILYAKLSRPSLPEDEDRASLRKVAFLGRIHQKTKSHFSATVISHLFLYGWRSSSLAPYVYRRNELLNSHNGHNRDYGLLGCEAVSLRERVRVSETSVVSTQKGTKLHSTLISKTASVSEKNSENATRLKDWKKKNRRLKKIAIAQFVHFNKQCGVETEEGILWGHVAGLGNDKGTQNLSWKTWKEDGTLET